MSPRGGEDGVPTVNRRDADRLESLRTYGLLDEGAPTFDEEVATAALVCGTRSAVVALLLPDVVRVHTAHEAAVVDIPREMSFSALAAESGLAIVLESIADDDRADHPYRLARQGVRSLAAVPLIGRDGIAIGVLGVHDPAPRRFTATQVEALRTIAAGTMTRLELHRLDRWGGRGGEHTFDPREIRAAMDAGQLVPFFQPIVELATGDVAEVEALVRWRHPRLGLISPAEFLPMVEASGLMIPLGRQVRQGALDGLIRLRGLGPGTARLRVAVNVSTIELSREDLAREVLADLADRGLEPPSLSLELTETAEFVDEEGALRQLRELRDAGVRIALDDYGVGFSSLARMVGLPLSTIKIDKSLTDEVLTDRRLGTAVVSTVWTAGVIGLDVIVEGIETAQQAAHVAAMGCGYGQGLHFSGPLPLHEVAALLADQAAGSRSGLGGAAGWVAPRAEPSTSGLDGVNAASLLLAWPGAASLVDTSRRVRAWNPEIAALTGYGVADVLGMPCSTTTARHVDADGHPLCARGCPVASAMRHGRKETRQLWLRHRDGRLLPVVVSASPVTDARGVLAGAIETVRLDPERLDGVLEVPQEDAELLGPDAT